MKKTIVSTLTIGLLSAFLAATVLPVGAAEEKKPAAENANPNRKMPFHGKIAEVDKTAKTIKIGTRTFQVTAETKILKEGDKPATLDDAKVGEMAGGSFKDNGGKLELFKLHVGPRPEGEKKKDGEKKKE